jgi:hypothetical protein
VPDLVTHVAANFLAGKAARAGRALPAFIAGAVLPDIVSRAPAIVDYRFGGLGAPFHSFFGLLALCYAIALLLPEKERRLNFAWLTAGAFLHLGLDALQRHLGPGLPLLFPFSWWTYSRGLFWPEDSLLAAGPLTGIVLLVVGWEKRNRVTRLFRRFR